MNRRQALGALSAAALATAFRWTPAQLDRAARRAAGAVAAGGFQPAFFTAHEWETVRVLVDLIIPRDERSGGATDAGVPEFMDFMALERTEMQLPLRGGLAWIDARCRERFGTPFVRCEEAQRTAVLDDIAWPARAKPEHSPGVAFFNRFRDLTASGFWSSKMGVADLGYQGNAFLAEWRGCPAEQLRRLGVGYGD